MHLMHKIFFFIDNGEAEEGPQDDNDYDSFQDPMYENI